MQRPLIVQILDCCRQILPLSHSVESISLNQSKSSHPISKKDQKNRIKTLSPLLDLINSLTPLDVGLDLSSLTSLSAYSNSSFQPIPSVSPSSPSSFPTRVFCQKIFANSHFELDVFVLPPRAQIPLHNHPGMMVISKVLFGGVEISAFDHLPVENHGNKISETNSDIYHDHDHDGKSDQREIDGINQHDQERKEIAICQMNQTFDETDDAFMLLPHHRNIHRLIASERGCAFFDILTPPYDGEERDCTYFSASPFFPETSFSSSSSLTLSPFLSDNFSPVVGELYHLSPVPFDDLNFFCLNEPYRGPSLF